MTPGWFYYDGDGQRQPTLEEQAAARGLQVDTFGAELCNISVVLCEKRPIVTVGFGGDLTRDEVRTKTREFVEQGIEALTGYLANLGVEEPGPQTP